MGGREARRERGRAGRVRAYPFALIEAAGSEVDLEADEMGDRGSTPGQRALCLHPLPPPHTSASDDQQDVVDINNSRQRHHGKGNVV